MDIYLRQSEARFRLVRRWSEEVPTWILRWVRKCTEGENNSGDVCDISFYEMAEKDLCLNPVVPGKYHIEFYARFRDDIFVVASGDSRSRKGFIDIFPG